MNGKNRRIRGCSSRGSGYIRLKEPKSNIIKPSYNLHKFSQIFER